MKIASQQTLYEKQSISISNVMVSENEGKHKYFTFTSKQHTMLPFDIENLLADFLFFYLPHGTPCRMNHKSLRATYKKEIE